MGGEIEIMLYNDNNLTLPQMVYYNKCKMKELIEKMEELMPKRYKYTIPAENWEAKEGYAEVSIIGLPYDGSALILSPEEPTDATARVVYLQEFAKINEMAIYNYAVVLRCYNATPTIDLDINIIKFPYEEVI